MTEPLWPNAQIQLVGENGNAFSILGRAGTAIRKAYGPEAEKVYLDEAMSGDYNHLLFFTVTNLTTEQEDRWDDDEDDETDSWGDRYEDYDDEEDDDDD